MTNPSYVVFRSCERDNVGTTLVEIPVSDFGEIEGAANYLGILMRFRLAQNFSARRDDGGRAVLMGMRRVRADDKSLVLRRPADEVTAPDARRRVGTGGIGEVGEDLRSLSCERTPLLRKADLAAELDAHRDCSISKAHGEDRQCVACYEDSALVSREIHFVVRRLAAIRREVQSGIAPHATLT